MEEFEATEEAQRRVKWGKWQGKVQKTEQIRVNPADVSNTVLKMAKKRGQIDLTLTALGCSDLFAQDLEDLDESLRNNFAQEPEGDPDLLKHWVEQALAQTDVKALEALWKTGVKAIQAAKDKPAYAAFKAAVTQKKAELPLPEPDPEFVEAMGAE
jgi:hypothetical protein